MNADYILDKYIKMMTGKCHSINLIIDPAGFNVSDAALDDAYKIEVKNGKGEIRASNKRSTLFAVYHLLRECGCGFSRPGQSSEVIPSGMSLACINGDITVEDAYRFRGICIEGSVGLDAVSDILEWMPKVGLNTYFMQFREGFTFFDRYYSEKYNKSRIPIEFNTEISRDITKRIVSKAKELDLMYHGVGHGFHIECFGINGLNWEPNPGIWPKEYEYAMALLSGPSLKGAAGDENAKRAMHWDIPMITALCYENEAVQDIVVEKAVEYIAAHDELDYLHFWLDDGYNNKCECDLCKDVLISDSYVRLLNKLNEKLTGIGNTVKIVFLSYCETLWPPQKEILKNTKRFTFMFAPIARDGLKPLWQAEAEGELEKYTLNKQPFPKNAGKLIAHLNAWNKYREKIGADSNDSFDFDYYGISYKDPGQFTMAKVIYGDIINLKRHGLNGVVNCQQQRLFTDAALPMYVYAMSLLQPNREFDHIADSFFNEAFGPENGKIFRRYFENLTAASEFLRQDSEPNETAAFNRLDKMLEAPLPKINCVSIGTAESVRLLSFSTKLYRLLSAVWKAKINKNDDELKSTLKAAKDYAVSYAAQFDTDFDLQAYEGILAQFQK